MPKPAPRANRLYAVSQTILVFAFAAAVFLDISPQLPFLPPLPTTGAIVSLAGVALMAAAFAFLRTAVQIAPIPKEGAHLVTSGVYRYFRHPIYTGMVLVALGLFLRRPSYLVGAAALVLILFLFFKARFEESLLRTRYAEYDEYRQRTWGVLPWFRRARSTEVSR
jgi:protein-S-isoprenylcysteine O-methyltransferase Ste14